MRRTPKTTRNFSVLTILGVFVVIVLWFTLPVILFNAYSDQKIPQELGIIGDMFGSVNALFAGLGLLLVAVTLRQGQNGLKIQQEELRLQREELVESRKVLADQAAAQEQMSKAILKLKSEIRMTSLVTGLSALSSTRPTTPEMTKDHDKLRRYLDNVNSHNQSGYAGW